MNVSDIQNETWFKTHSDTNTYSASDILAGMNMYNGQIIQKILKVQTTRNQNITNEYYNFVSTNGLAQGQVGFNGEYPFPPDLLRPLRVEVSYDGVTWLPCKQYDINAGNMTSEYNPSQINSAFQTTSNPNYNPYISTPYVRYTNDSFFIRPLNQGNTVPVGFVFWYESRQPALANSTDVPAFEANFHELLVYKLAMRYGEKYPEKMNKQWIVRAQELEKELVEFYKNRFKYNVTMSVSFERFK